MFFDHTQYGSTTFGEFVFALLLVVASPFGVFIGIRMLLVSVKNKEAGAITITETGIMLVPKQSPQPAQIQAAFDALFRTARARPWLFGYCFLLFIVCIPLEWVYSPVPIYWSGPAGGISALQLFATRSTDFVFHELPGSTTVSVPKGTTSSEHKAYRWTLRQEYVTHPLSLYHEVVRTYGPSGPLPSRRQIDDEVFLHPDAYDSPNEYRGPETSVLGVLSSVCGVYGMLYLIGGLLGLLDRNTRSGALDSLPRVLLVFNICGTLYVCLWLVSPRTVFIDSATDRQVSTQIGWGDAIVLPAKTWARARLMTQIPWRIQVVDNSGLFLESARLLSAPNFLSRMFVYNVHGNNTYYMYSAKYR